MRLPLLFLAVLLCGCATTKNNTENDLRSEEANLIIGLEALETNDLDAASTALNLAPVNAHYLAELGHVYHIRQDWHGAREVFW